MNSKLILKNISFLNKINSNFNNKLEQGLELSAKVQPFINNIKEINKNEVFRLFKSKSIKLDPYKRITTLGPGKSFGEKALMNIQKQKCNYKMCD